jgi:molybdopterin synthase sulfur carrier subunit
VAIVRLFASAREAAGTGRDDVSAASVGELLAIASERYGERFVDVLRSCRIWVNGESATADTALTARDEVAVLPPVSGGAC